MARTGRPTLLTPELQAELVRYVGKGNYLETAAALCGITVKTMRNWMERGEAASGGQFREFFLAMKKAEASVERRDLALIGKAATRYWQAAAWRLERRHPERWMRRERRELTGANGAALNLDTATSAAQSAARKALLIDEGGGRPKREPKPKR